MTLFQFLQLLRRYRLLVLIAIIVGIGAGWISAPGSGAEPAEFEATHTLIANDQSRTPLNIPQAALLATRGAVVEQAAAALGEDQRIVRRSVSARGDEEVRSVLITAKDVNRTKAEARADAVAEALKAELSTAERQEYDTELNTHRERVDQLNEQIRNGSDGSASGDAALQAATAELTSASQQLSQLELAGPPEPPLTTVERARARVADTGLTAPQSKPARAVLLGLFGLLLGVGAAMALDRLDTRIHSKEAAEAAYGFPVIAEIPVTDLSAKGSRGAAQMSPSSHIVEAYRGLRGQVTLATQEEGVDASDGRRAPIILVTSAVAGEGKTTTAAYLSVLLGEVGRSTLLVSGDFRRPRLHELLGRGRSPGLTEVLGSERPTAGLGDLDLSTSYPLVQFLASGAPSSTPAMVVKRVPQLLRAAQPNWDFIVVDSAPLLVANDTADLARDVTGVVILSRAGHTSIDAAKRASEMLRRIGAPVLGVVLVGATDALASYRYGYGYYMQEEAGAGRRGNRTRPPTASTGSNGASARRRSSRR